MKYPLVLVIWDDAVSGHGWEAIQDIDSKPHEIHTVGYMVKQTKEAVTLVMSLDHENDYQNCTFVVPKGMIKEIKKLKIVK